MKQQDSILDGLRRQAAHFEGTELEDKARKALEAYEAGDYARAGRLQGEITRVTTG